MTGTGPRHRFVRLDHLSDEQVVELAKRGDRDAIEHILCRYRGLVEGKARAYFLIGADHDDVIQEGMIGLYKAIRDYQPDRLVRFRAFADLCVTRQIISAIKGATRQKHAPLNTSISLQASATGECRPWCGLVPGQTTVDPERLVLDRSLAEYLERVADHELSDLERHVILCRLRGMTYRQMATALKCPPKSVDNALQRAKRKIWNHLARAT